VYGIGPIGGRGGLQGAGDVEEAAAEPARGAGGAAPASAGAPRTRGAGAVAALPFGRGSIQTKILGRKALPEPSGIAFHPARGTLFAVGDRGHIVEMTREGEVLVKARLKKDIDLEAICVGPKGLLYAATEEAPAQVIEIDPKTLEVTRRFKIDVKVGGEKLVARRANDGIEGLAWSEKERCYFALNQDRPPRIVRLEVPLDEKKGGKAKIKETIDLHDAVAEWGSDLSIDARTGHFLVTEAGDAGVKGALHEIARDGTLVRSVRLPGKTQEGFALDDRGSAYVAQDDGGVIRIDPA
jgi:uncharacterized protein YjiK